MNSDNWDRAKQLFEAALELDSSRRALFLRENCREEELRQQVEKLLNNYQEAGSFLDDPAFNPRIPVPSSPRGQTEEASRPLPQSADFYATATDVEANDPMVGCRLGAYKVVRRIGQGGMAAVFLASRADDEYRKLVAVKLVQPGLDNRDLLNRFRNERQTLAGLDHPNIIKLLDGGSTPDGLPFLVMDYVEGSPIDEYCDQHRLSVDRRLHLFGKVCDAVQYAHEKLVVHRDLKPSNILVVADGAPKLLDFGISKVLDLKPSSQNLLVTQTGTRCMTPAYASPEQMRGKAVTPASDIYSLGVVLYELLTGHRPYRLAQHTPAEIERAICDEEPETPSTAISRVETDTCSDGTPVTKTPELVSKTREGQPDKLRRRLRGDLDNIVLKALQKDPQRRYDSVKEFSEDIERHLQHLPVKARRSSLTYRATKFAQRHKIEVSSILAILFVVVAAMAFAFNLVGLRDRVSRIDSVTPTAMVNTSHPFNPKGWVRTTQRGSTFDVRLIPGSINPVVSCESIFNLKLPNTTITATQSTSGGNFTLPDANPISNLPSFCRVEGIISPSSDSDIRFEIWMPSAGWNGRFRAVGNGGFGGSINFDDMAPAIRLGYATASTDSGHQGDYRDTTWALHHPEKVVDIGYRAIHEMTEKSKQIIRAFYGQAPAWSFFEGCSNGGRQALMEAQRFPDDYDGVLAGAAPMFTTHILAAGLYDSTTDRASYIPPSKIPAISRAVLAACDALDGINDGILNDPRQCHFDPSALLCAGTDSEKCLTPPQVSQLKKIYLGLQNSRGEQLFPGYVPGGEEGEEGWKAWIIGTGTPDQALNYIFGLGVFRDMVFDDPSWDFRMVNAERAIQIAEKKIGRIIDTQQSDLQRFKAHGGKLILYHGWSDPETPGTMAIDYYNAVLATMGSEGTDAFVRLYMAPGMQHCYGGPGPNFFGQFDLSALGGNPQQVPIATDSEHNISTALERWVENGVAPTAIIATKYVNDLDPSQGIKMTRPLCPYPKVARYKGTGDTNDATNFLCKD